MDMILKYKDINAELVKYIENEIFPLYNRNEDGHGIKHIKTVIKRSLELATNYDVNLDMVYKIASYHDLGHYIDRKIHEIISAEIFIKDDKIKQWFTNKQRNIIKEAIEDHRASSNHKPRSIYGMIVSTADRTIIDIDNTIKRSYSYGKRNYILLFNVIKNYIHSKKIILYCIMGVIIYAASDEFHQYFVPGRSAAIKDVFIDSCGGIAASIVNNLFYKVKNMIKD